MMRIVDCRQRNTGYAAPQLHTHTVIFNLTETDDGRIKPIQPLELYRSQRYATEIYRSVLATELQKLGQPGECVPTSHFYVIQIMGGPSGVK